MIGNQIKTKNIEDAELLSFFFFLVFFLLLTEIVNEKESRIRIGMRLMGLSNAVYWYREKQEIH